MPTFKATVETEVEVDFEVFCARCGAGLRSQSGDGNTGRRNYPYVNVQPCTVCLDDRSEESYSKGYEQGFKEGCDSGWVTGHAEGYSDGYDTGCEDTLGK